MKQKRIYVCQKTPRGWYVAHRFNGRRVGFITGKGLVCRYKILMPLGMAEYAAAAHFATVNKKDEYDIHLVYSEN